MENDTPTVESEKIKPYNETGASKKTEVRNMFNSIARRYDFLNHFLSLGIDRCWRRRAIKQLRDLDRPRLLDVATGTADMAIMAQRMLGCKVVGTDLSAGMLAVGKQKIEELGKSDEISLAEADSEQLPFADGEFDALTVAFGVRNYENLDRGLQQMSRVLRSGGRMVILEFSHPQYFPFKQIYLFYFRYVLPFVGGLFSKDRKAYEYLPESVLAFPCGKEFEKHMIAAGVTPTKRISLTFGVATIYVGEKQ